MVFFVSHSTFHQQGVGCTRGGYGSVSELDRNKCSFIHVRASKRCLWSGTKKAVLPFVRATDRLAIIACFFLPDHRSVVLTHKCRSSSQVHLVTPSPHTCPFSFLCQKHNSSYSNTLTSLPHSVAHALVILNTQVDNLPQSLLL